MREILIIGSGYHSKVVLSEVIKIKDCKVIGFVDENKKKKSIIEKYKNKSFKVVGNIKGIKKFLNKNTEGIIAVGSNFKRKKIADEINKNYKNFKWATIISNNSIINGKVNVGKGTLIMSGVIINTGTTIGDHCLINTSSSIDHDNILENFSSTGPGVTTGGNVRLGEFSHLGIGSTIKEQTSIGNDTIVGAKSLVLKNCDKNSIYFGNPAKKIKERKHDSEYL